MPVVRIRIVIGTTVVRIRILIGTTVVWIASVVESSTSSDVRTKSFLRPCRAAISGYLHDGRADKDYPHDCHADNAFYWHDRRADKNPYRHDRNMRFSSKLNYT